MLSEIVKGSRTGGEEDAEVELTVGEDVEGEDWERNGVLGLRLC